MISVARGNHYYRPFYVSATRKTTIIRECIHQQPICIQCKYRHCPKLKKTKTKKKQKTKKRKNNATSFTTRCAMLSFHGQTVNYDCTVYVIRREMSLSTFSFDDLSFVSVPSLMLFPILTRYAERSNGRHVQAETVYDNPALRSTSQMACTTPHRELSRERPRQRAEYPGYSRR